MTDILQGQFKTKQANPDDQRQNTINSVIDSKQALYVLHCHFMFILGVSFLEF